MHDTNMTRHMHSLLSAVDFLLPRSEIMQQEVSSYCSHSRITLAAPAALFMTTQTEASNLIYEVFAQSEEPSTPYILERPITVSIVVQLYRTQLHTAFNFSGLN